MRATDSGGLWIEDTFTVTVNPQPDLPVLIAPIADFNVDEDAGDTIIDLTTVFDDVDLPGDTLVFTIESNTNPALVPIDITGGTLTLSYAADQHGTADITVRATDQDGAGVWVEDGFTVIVDPINDSPMVVNPIIDFDVDEDAADTIIDLSTIFDDVDLPLDMLTMSIWSNSNPALVAANVVGDELTLSYLADQYGSADITVRAADSSVPSLFAVETFTVTVNPIDDAPTVLNPIDDVSVIENDPDTILDLSSVFYDAEDGVNLTLTIGSNTNPGLVSADLVSGVLTLSYAANQTGSSSITIRAADSGIPGQWVDEQFDVSVNSSNFAPTVASEISDVTVNAGDQDTVLYLSDVFDDSAGLYPTLDYTVIEIDPVTGAQSAGTGLYVYEFTVYGHDGMESAFATTTLTFTGDIRQTRAFGSIDVNDEASANLMEGVAGSGYIAAIDTWTFAGWSGIAPSDTDVSGSTLVMSVGSGVTEYYQQKDLVRVVAGGAVGWTGLFAREGVDYATSGTADANRLVYTITGNTNPGLVTVDIVGARAVLI